jgi:hypothetical protein
MSQVEGYMHEFRERALPIDSFIMDYDWFGPDPCPAEDTADTTQEESRVVGMSGELLTPTPQGGYNCGDSGYRRGWWNNMTFVQPGGSEVHCATAADVFDHFHAPPLSLHFGGIRKPRTYSNKEMCKKNG